MVSPSIDFQLRQPPSGAPVVAPLSALGQVLTAVGPDGHFEPRPPSTIGEVTFGPPSGGDDMPALGALITQEASSASPRTIVFLDTGSKPYYRFDSIYVMSAGLNPIVRGHIRMRGQKIRVGLGPSSSPTISPFLVAVQYHAVVGSLTADIAAGGSVATIDAATAPPIAIGSVLEIVGSGWGILGQVSSLTPVGPNLQTALVIPGTLIPVATPFTVTTGATVRLIDTTAAPHGGVPCGFVLDCEGSEISGSTGRYFSFSRTFGCTLSGAKFTGEFGVSGEFDFSFDNLGRQNVAIAMISEVGSGLSGALETNCDSLIIDCQATGLLDVDGGYRSGVVNSLLTGIQSGIALINAQDTHTRELFAIGNRLIGSNQGIACNVQSGVVRDHDSPVIVRNSYSSCRTGLLIQTPVRNAVGWGNEFTADHDFDGRLTNEAQIVDSAIATYMAESVFRTTKPGAPLSKATAIISAQGTFQGVRAADIKHFCLSSSLEPCVVADWFLDQSALTSDGPPFSSVAEPDGGRIILRQGRYKGPNPAVGYLVKNTNIGGECEIENLELEVGTAIPQSFGPQPLTIWLRGRISQDIASNFASVNSSNGTLQLTASVTDTYAFPNLAAGDRVLVSREIPGGTPAAITWLATNGVGIVVTHDVGDLSLIRVSIDESGGRAGIIAADG